MSASNKTQNYDLPLFIGTDIPSWLVDWNNAMTAIDTVTANAYQKGNDASESVVNMQESVNALQSGLVTANNQIVSLQSQINILNTPFTYSEALNTPANCSISLITNSLISVLKGEIYPSNGRNITIGGDTYKEVGYFPGNIFHIMNCGSYPSFTTQVLIGSLTGVTTLTQGIPVLVGCYDQSSDRSYIISETPQNTRFFFSEPFFMTGNIIPTL